METGTQTFDPLVFVLDNIVPHIHSFVHTNLPRFSPPHRTLAVILNDVTFTVMSELLQFMYQGVVNVKHTDLTAFMKIAQALQIKGLTTSLPRPSVSGSPAAAPIAAHNMTTYSEGGASGLSATASGSLAGGVGVGCIGDESAGSASFQSNAAGNNVTEPKCGPGSIGGRTSAAGGVGAGGAGHVASDLSGSHGGQKRSLEFGGADGSKRASLMRRGSEGGLGYSHHRGGGGVGGDASTEHEMHCADSMENMSGDEVFMPQMSMLDAAQVAAAAAAAAAAGRFDLSSVKRESLEPLLSPATMMRNVLQPPFGFDYATAGLYGAVQTQGGSSGVAAGGSGGAGVGSGGGAGSSASSTKNNVEYANELHVGGGEFGKGGGGFGSLNHMDIPAGMYDRGIRCGIE